MKPEIIIYQTEDGKTKIETHFENETVWLTQAQISELFQKERSVITKHINNIFSEGELDEQSNVQNLHISGSDRPVKFYNLDVIISVGYRVKSHRGVHNAYNSLGLGLTQLYNTTWVYNHKRHGEFFLNGKNLLFKLKSAFPVTLSKEFLVVDLINNLDELAEDQEQIVKNFQKNVNRFEAHELARMAQQYGSGRTKKLAKSVLRKTRLMHV